MSQLTSFEGERIRSMFGVSATRLPGADPLSFGIESLDEHRHVKELLRERPLSVKEEVFLPAGLEPLHRHSACWQLFIGIEGEMVIATPESEALLRRDAVVAIAPGTMHTAENRSSDPARFLIVSTPGTEFDRELITPESPSADCGAYVRRLSGLVGDRDPVAVLAETPQAIEQALIGVGDECLDTRPYPSKWTPREIVSHFVDAAMNRSIRFWSILTGGHPVLPGYHERELVDLRSREESEITDVIAMFTMIQRSDVRLLNRSRDRLGSIGHHIERGDTTLGDLVRLEAGHDLHHLEQLRRYISAAMETRR